MTQEMDQVLKTIEAVGKLHKLLYGGIRVKTFQNLIVLDSHLRTRFHNSSEVWKKVAAKEPYVFKNYANYLSLAERNGDEINHVSEFLRVSRRTARDYLKTLNRLNNPLGYFY